MQSGSSWVSQARPVRKEIMFKTRMIFTLLQIIIMFLNIHVHASYIQLIKSGDRLGLQEQLIGMYLVVRLLAASLPNTHVR
jgi:hypothetical protein